VTEKKISKGREREREKEIWAAGQDRNVSVVVVVSAAPAEVRISSFRIEQLLSSPANVD
jgi:hypothetical protein